jgi:hypothetical protein
LSVRMLRSSDSPDADALALLDAVGLQSFHA